MANNGVLIVREDTAIKGDIRNCRQIEIYGYVEGDLAAQMLLIHRGGKFRGRAKTENAEVHGTLEGDVVVKHLINIRTSGTVVGNVRYGQLEMELGGSLSAEVKNVPPTLSGDLDLMVARGRSVRITLTDLNAIDPDDKAEDLKFTVSNAVNGFVILSGAPNRPVNGFTQADLAGGNVMFTHNGSNTPTASFDVVVVDAKGGSSGAPQTIKVAVHG